MKRLLLTLPLVLSGCVYPVHDYDRANALAAGADISLSNVETVETAKQLLSGWQSQLEDAATTRQKTELVASEILYYGTLLMVGGSTAMAATTSADPLHIRNIGAGLGLGSTLFSSHYKINEQRTVFERASTRLNCVLDAAADINKKNHDLFIASAIAAPPLEDGKPFLTAYDDIPRQIVYFIERQTVPDLQAALRSITLGAASREELLATIQAWNKARTEAAQAGEKAIKDEQAKTDASGVKTNAALQALTEEQLANIRRFMTAVPALPAALKLCREENPLK